MSERRSSADLGPKTEALLGAFPIPERDWESDARAIEARLSEGGAIDELLFAAPLPPEPAELNAVSATATPLANSGVRKQSLAELARRSVEKKQAEKRELARASLAIAAGRKPIPSDTREPPPPSAQSAVVARHVVARDVVARAPETTLGRAEAAPSAWPKLALGLPMLALAAAALLWLRPPAGPAPLVSNSLPNATSQAKPVSAAAAPVVGDAAGNEPTSPRGIDPSTLPGEAAAKPAEVARSKTTTPGAAASAPLRPNAKKVVLDEREPTAVVGAQPAVPAKTVDKGLPPDTALRPADSSGGALPMKPSSGAVQAALGAVMSGARHCVAGDDAPSSAVVRFGSDGRVQGVVVSGPAAGKASGACIEAQLTRARVQPFAASNFSVNATLRPD
ncbi:MAG: hypothetical protein ABIQ16_03610 [Polyangiaceae bacterium]